MISLSWGDGAFLRNGNLQRRSIAFPIMHLSGDIDLQREFLLRREKRKEARQPAVL
jgi:hypothetical protein